MTSSSELIVLHLTKTGDNSVVIHTLSREYGRRSFYVRGVGKGPVMTMFLPMNILECEITENPRSSLASARKPVLMYPLLGIRDSLYKNSMTIFMSEVLYRAVKEGVDEPGLYDWCRSSILLLDALESDFSNFHIRFLLELAVALGFRPSAEDLAPFAGENLALLSRFMSEPFSRAMLVSMSGTVRSQIADSLLKYLEFHTESALNVNSLRILHELLA